MLPNWLDQLFFDRFVEVYWTYDLATKAKATAKLHAFHIPYRVRVRGASGPMRSARGMIPTTGLRNAYLYHYTVLVRRSTLETLPPDFFHDLAR